MDEKTKRERARNHPPSMAAVLGEDLGPAAYGDVDAPKPAAPQSSAARHASRRQHNDVAAALARDVATVQEAAAVEAAELALAEATRLARDGKEVPPQLARRAAAAAKAKGIGRRSSAEELAHRYRERTR